MCPMVHKECLVESSKCIESNSIQFSHNILLPTNNDTVGLKGKFLCQVSWGLPGILGQDIYPSILVQSVQQHVP